jgi:hypothetical protein
MEKLLKYKTIDLLKGQRTFIPYFCHSILNFKSLLVSGLILRPKWPVFKSTLKKLLEILNRKVSC